MNELQRYTELLDKTLSRDDCPEELKDFCKNKEDKDDLILYMCKSFMSELVEDGYKIYFDKSGNLTIETKFKDYRQRFYFDEKSNDYVLNSEDVCDILFDDLEPLNNLCS